MQKTNQYYSEIYCTNTISNRIYHKYLHNTRLEQLHHKLVIAAIILTLASVVLEILMHNNKLIIDTIHIISPLIFAVFISDLLKHYALSQSRKQFLKKHWLDITLLTIILSCFLFVSYFGFARIRTLSNLENAAKEIKHVKVIMKLFNI